MANLIQFNLDPAHSLVNFSVKHLGIAKVNGQFRSVSGSLKVDPEDVSTLEISALMDATTFTTNDDKRDAHVKTSDLLDVAKYPTIEFKSTSAKKIGDDEFDVTGDLTLHGVTKSVTIRCSELSDEMTDPWGGKRFAIEGKTKINRSDFGVTYNLALANGGWLIGEEIKIELDLQFVRVQ